MAGALVQSNHNRNAGSATLAVTLTGVVAGNTLVYIGSNYNGGGGKNISGVAGGGATWTERSARISGNIALEIWVGTGGTGGSITVTATIASASDNAGILMEISGLDATTPFDVKADASGSSTSPESGATATLAQADSFKVMGMAHESGTITMNPRAGDGDTEVTGEEAGDSGMVVGGAYQVLAATTAVNGRWTIGSSANWVASVVVLKAAAGGGGGTTVTPGTASLTLSAFAPQANQRINAASPTALTLAAFAPTVSSTANQTVTPGTLALVLAAFAPQLRETLTPATLAMALSAFAPTVTAAADQTVTPGVLALTLASFAPQLRETLTAQLLALTLTAFAPQLRETLTPGQASLQITGFAPVLDTRINGAAPTALVLATFAPALRETVTPGVLNLALSPFAPQLREVVTPGAASLSLTAFAPSIGAPIVVTPGPATLVVVTFPPVLTGIEAVALAPIRFTTRASANSVLTHRAGNTVLTARARSNSIIVSRGEGGFE